MVEFSGCDCILQWETSQKQTNRTFKKIASKTYNNSKEELPMINMDELDKEYRARDIPHSLELVVSMKWKGKLKKLENLRPLRIWGSTISTSAVILLL